MRFFIGFFLTLGFFLIDSSQAIALKYDVCFDCKIQTIKSAIKRAKSGDEIFIHKGTYLESDIEIDKSLKITGEKGSIIDGKNIGTIIAVKADNVEISNLTLKNVGYEHIKDYAAILVHKSNHFVIKNVTMEKVLTGIKIEKSKNGIIANNIIFSGNQSEIIIASGISVWHSSDLKIKNNTVYGMRDGIYFEFVKDSTIENNTAYKNYRYGLHFMFSNNNSYINNDFFENGAGVAVMFSKYIIMKKNKFRNNWGSASYGLLLKEIYDADITENKFFKNTVAIYVEGSTRVNYFKNQFHENGWAIKVAGACYKNIVKKNNFIGNSFDVSYHSNINDNEFSNNYWSSYTGYDLNKDAIGDVPYRPVKLFSFLVARYPESIILHRSLFIDLINFSEKVSPIFTPDNIIDKNPAMREYE